MRLLKLVPDNTNIDFMRWRHWALILSLLATIASLTLVGVRGLNLGIDFLPGAFGYDAAFTPEREMAGRILWLDALCANVDRSWRNPNLLLWHGEVWAIDHGAALYFHHAWTGGPGSSERFAAQPYDASEHILRHYAAEAQAQDGALAAQVTEEALTEVLALVPDEWLEPVPGAESPEGLRARYVEFLRARVSNGRAWLPTTEVAG